jgi:hypothetical protein
MSKVVPLPYHVAFGVLCLSILWGIYSANAKQAAGPLAVTTTVINSCTVAVVSSVPERSVALMSSAMNTSEIIRARCREATIWRVEVEKSTSDGVMKKVEQTPSASGTPIRVTINF